MTNLQQPVTSDQRPAIGCQRLARLAEIGPDGSLWLAGPDGPQAARILHTVARQDLERAQREGLPLLVADCDGAPVVLGVVLGRAEAAPELRSADGRTVLTGRRRLELRCGDAALTLAADGTVAISGSEVRSRAKRLQRITGAQVKIN